MAQLKSTKVFGDLNVTGEVNASTKITVNGNEVWDKSTLLNIGTTAATARTALGLGAGATRWPTFAEVTGKPSTYAPSGHTHPTSQVTGLDTALAGKANTSTQVIAGTGLTGGGTLAANRTLAVSYGTAAGTAAQGNDSRITGALQSSQVVQATGTSTTDVMSQKATTDQLATKAASSHTHPWTQVTGQPATATRWPTFAEVTGKPTNYATTWASVASKPAQATRWPTLAEVTDKPTNYPTNWATVSNKPIVQTVGASTTNLMSQAAVTNAFNNSLIGAGQTWQDMGASRDVEVYYTNSTGRTIALSFWVSSTPRTDAYIGITVGDQLISQVNSTNNSTGNSVTCAFAIVPHGVAYKVEASGNIVRWNELR